MTIAVTAASGQLGTSIVEALKQQATSQQVVALARSPEKASTLGVEVRPGDYNDSLQLLRSLQGVDTLLLVSGMDAPDKRIIQHRNVIKSAIEAGVQRIVYTSVQGAAEGTAFSPVIQSNRQTEDDIKQSGLEWVIGRNGIYIEPDLEYVENYKKRGAIINCAGDGKCGYTSRGELGYAYACLLTDKKHNGQTYNLHGEAITQRELANYINMAFETDLVYRTMTVEEYRQDRIEELGEFIGTVISGIYQGILMGKSDNPSHYKLATGRDHIGWQAFFSQVKANRA